MTNLPSSNMNLMSSNMNIKLVHFITEVTNKLMLLILIINMLLFAFDLISVQYKAIRFILWKFRC